MNELMRAIAEHLTIVAVSMFFAAILGIALGVISYWRRKLGSVIISIAELIQTIPSPGTARLLMIIFGLGDLTMGVASCLCTASHHPQHVYQPDPAATAHH